MPDYLDSAAGGGRLVVQSFDAGSMHRFHRLLPEVPVGVLGTPARKHLPGPAEWASPVNPHHRTVDAGYVAAVHGTGMDCQVWTLNRVSDMRRALAPGVDGVITNRPDGLGAVLRRELLPAA